MKSAKTVTAKKAPAKKGRGRIGHVPTKESRNQVELLSGIGIPVEQIGLIIGIDKKTVFKHYRAEMDIGQAKALSKISNRLFDIATGETRESLSACIFWLKCRAGWKPPADFEVNIDNSQKAVVVNLPADQEDALKRVIEDAQQRVKRIP
jgi:hypothetical protein